MARFGVARLYREDLGILDRLYYRTMGLADPSHFLRSQYFRRFMTGLVPAAILDAGCGAGDYSFFLAQAFPKASVDGIDLDASLIARNEGVRARIGLTNLRFGVRDVGDIADTAKYDLILCVDALEHVPSQETVLENFYRALIPGGHLFLHMPLVRPRPVPLDRYLGGFHEWSAREHIAPERSGEEFVQMVKNAGFEVERSQYTFGYWSGEMACSLFALFHDDTKLNRVVQGLISPATRVLAHADLVREPATGFAMAIRALKRES